MKVGKPNVVMSSGNQANEEVIGSPLPTASKNTEKAQTTIVRTKAPAKSILANFDFWTVTSDSLGLVNSDDDSGSIDKTSPRATIAMGT